MVKKVLRMMLALMLLTTCAVGGALAQTGLEPYPGLKWHSDPVDALMLQNDYMIAFKETDEGGAEREILVTTGTEMGDYHTDTAILVFEEDALTGVYSMIRSDCSTFAYDNLDAALRRSYGDPACFDPELMGAESFDSVFGHLKDIAEDEIMKEMHSMLKLEQGFNVGCKLTEHRAWEFDDGSRLMISYYKAGLFFLEDYISVAYIRAQ